MEKKIEVIGPFLPVGLPHKKEDVCLNIYMWKSHFVDTGSRVRRSKGRPRAPSAKSSLKIYEVLSTGPAWFDRLVVETGLARNTVGRTLRYLVSRSLVLSRRSGKRVLYQIREDNVSEAPLRAVAWAKLTSRPKRKAERTRRDEFFKELLALWWSPEAKELRSLNPEMFRVSLLDAVRRLRPPFDIVKRMRGELDVRDYKRGIVNAILWDSRGEAYWSRTAIDAPEHDYERPTRVQYVSRITGKKRTRLV